MADENIIAPPDATIETVLVIREQIEQAAFPDLRMKDYVILKDGPKAFKVATHWEIIDRNTGEFHHHKVKIDTYHLPRAGWEHIDRLSVVLAEVDWNENEQAGITLGAEGGDELQKLTTFLLAIQDERLPEIRGEYLVVPVAGEVANDESLRQLLSVVSDGAKAGIVASALATAKGDPEVLRSLAEQAAADPETSKGVAAALNLASFRRELQTLDELIGQDVREGAFQRLLTRNPWMFGSEYSKLLDMREFTAGQQQDFMLRRTADSYLEIVEIKTPLGGAPLFLFDESHRSYYPRAELSQVVGQVMGYLEEIDAIRDTIERRYGEKVNKIRAKVVIGRDVNADQIAALRRYDSHLHRIEILTFDQLLNTARQVVGYLERAVLMPTDNPQPAADGVAPTGLRQRLASAVRIN